MSENFFGTFVFNDLDFVSKFVKKVSKMSKMDELKDLNKKFLS